MKQTAVEWLIENIPDLGKYIPFGVSMELHAKFQQSLEMEKQQIENMYSEEEVKHIVSEALQSALVTVDLEQWFKQFKKK
jgi:hypothetical protein